MSEDFSRFLAAVEADPRIELHSVVALHRGRPVVEAYWEPWRATDSVGVYSVSKTVTGSAVGIAIGEGRFGLHDRVAALIDPDRPVDPRIAEITVHHLLSMSTGHSADPDWYDGEDPVDHFFIAVPQEPVGSRHAYNNLASWMLGELVRRRTGEPLMDYLRPRLFEPLGIEPSWETDEQGRELGFTGLHVTTTELARLGELYRLGGAWQGRQLIPAEYVAQAGRRQIPTNPADDRDWTTGYGYQVWISREGYRLDGAFGQFCLVLPEREAVIALNSAQAPTSQPLLDLVFEHLAPAVTSGGVITVPTPLQLAPVPDDGEPGPWWADALEARSEHPVDLRDVRLARAGGGWRLSARLGDRSVELTTPGAGWHRPRSQDGTTLPFAVSAGVTGGTGRVLLAFTDTVHTLQFDLGQGEGAQAWRTAPLTPPPVVELITRPPAPLT